MKSRVSQWAIFIIAGVIAGSGATFYLMHRSQNEVPPPSQLAWEVDAAVLTKPAPMDPAAPENTPRYALHEAAAKGLVEYEIHGTGSSSGDSLLVLIRRLVDSTIDVYVVPGSVFRPSDAGAQQMVAWGVSRAILMNQTVQPATSMYLPDTDVHGYALEAYCLNFDLDNPSPQVSFQPKAEIAGQPVDQAVDVRAAQLIYEGKRRGLSFAGIQTAIWADHEHRTKQEIQVKFEAGAKEMDDAFEMAKRMPPPRVP